MTIEVLDPTGRSRSDDGSRQPSLAPRLASVGGSTVGFLDNLKPGASFLLRAVQGEVERTFGVRTVYFEKTGPKGSSGALESGEKLAEQVGAVINALGD